MNKLKIKITSNIEELKALIGKADIRANELQKTLDEISNFEVKVGFENISSN